MIFEAVYHSTGSEYCHAIDEERIVIRLRAARKDIKECILCYGNRVDYQNPIRTQSVKMELAASDRLFDYFEAEIITDLNRICYYFILYDGRQSVYYYNNDFHNTLEDDRNKYFQFPYVRKEDIAYVPGWAKEAIIYQIFPDSFATAKNYIACCSDEKTIFDDIKCKSKLGGTLKGITENINYLEDLGVTCIYLTPVFAANSYHKYDTIDYFTIDPCFGSNEDLKELVEKCHKSGIRVILDGVFNHTGADFFAFRDVIDKGKYSRYKDWYFIKDFPVRYDNNPNYECFAYVKNMPKLNTGNREVIEYFINVGVYWIKEADIDGWRLDVANEVDFNFWREFRKAVKSVKQDAFLIGEIWHDAREWLAGDQFDSVMNYNFNYVCKDFFAKRSINVEQFDKRINYLKMRYKKNIQYAQMNLLDSHDVPRFLSYCDNDFKRFKLAILFQMTHVGVPSIYYGDEKGFYGINENEFRRPMQWGEDDEITKNLFEYYKKLICIRKKYIKEMSGKYKTIQTDIKNNIYVYSRESEARKLIIAINNSNSTADVEIHFGTKCSCVKEIIEGKEYYVNADRLQFQLSDNSGVILEVANE